MSTTAAAYIIPAVVGAVLMFMGQSVSAWINSKTQRRQWSGDPSTVPGTEVYQEGQRLMGRLEADNLRLRQVETSYLKLSDDYARLRRQYEELEKRCESCPGRALRTNGSAS